MQELVPGIHHWSAPHPRIGFRVSSYYVEAARTLLDPILPEDEDLDWFARRDPAPRQIVLTNRHHYRHSDEFRDVLGGIPVRACRAGMHEFEGGPEVEPFDFGDRLAEGVTAIEIGGICPDDTALFIEAAEGAGANAIALADGLIRPPDGGPLCFVPDQLMGDPERDKRALLASLSGLLERDFEHLLLAHGEPLAREGKRALGEFLESQAA